MGETLPLVERFFPDLPAKQIDALSRFAAMVRDWNTRINLVSRKDVENLEERHLLHSLAPVKLWQPDAGATVLDLGTGGGFPGVPLAIVLPQCRFTLLDSIAKKTRAVSTMVDELGLKNAQVRTDRAEHLKSRFDFVFGRAIATLPQFLERALPLVRRGKHGKPPNGVFYFKGTNYREELAGSPYSPAHVWPLDALFETPFFAEKYLLHFAAAGSRPASPKPS